jgi:flagellar protein FliT
MLDFLRICAGFRRRSFFVRAARKLGVDWRSNRAIPARVCSLDFVAGARHGVRIEHRGIEDMPPDDGRGTAIARSQLLDHYDAIARASQLMLEAARHSDWDEVSRQEERCRILIAALKAASLEAPLRPADNRRRMDLLRRILADDAEIRGRADPWLKQLERLISSPRSRG